MADALASGASVRKDVGVQVPPRPQREIGKVFIVVHAFTELIESRNLLWNLTLRELRSKYRRSFLGWAWSLLNPLSNILIYSFVFGVVFGATAPIGEPSGLNVYALYLMCGILPWGFFALVTNLGMNALLSNASLVRKVSFARETLVISQVIFSFVQWSIEMLLLAAILIVAGSPIIAWLPVVILVMLSLAIYGAGFAMALAAAAVFFRDLRYLWTILLQVMFFATPIIYTPDRLEGKLPGFIEFILKWNPMAVFIQTFRHMLYGGGSPHWGELLYVVVVSVAVFFAGWAVFSRLSRRVAEEL